jgi:GntR family transcriptional regulator/MocR family aminotransferase
MLFIRLREDKDAPPLYRQIADQILFQIERGELAPGARLPSSRSLAGALGVARGTVVLAYEELCSTGLCESHVGRGASVCRGLPQAARRPGVLSPSGVLAPAEQDKMFVTPDEPVDLDPRELSLLPSIADTEHLPITDLRRAFDRVLRFPDHLRSFSESAGDPALRRLICEKILPERGVNADPSEVMIVPGTQYGAVLVALALKGSRRRIHFGSPGYLDIARNFARFGFEMVAHGVDAEGINISDAVLGQDDVLYIMPEHHFPQGVTLSDSRRALVEQMTEDKEVLVIEDDYDSEYYYDRMPKQALKAGKASSSIVYLCTFSKTLFNNLRLGYVVADANFIRELATLHWSLARGSSGLLQRWVAELIKEGVLHRHVQRMRTVYCRKRDRIAEVLRRDFPDWRFEKPKGGLQFFIDVGSPEVVRSILELCKQKRLKMASPSNYVLDQGEESKNFLVIGFGAVSLPQLLSALDELRAS